VSTDSKSERGLRLKIIADFILELAKEYEVGKIVLENVFFKHINATKALYQINGVLYYLFYDKDIITYQPQSVKAKICYGGAKKEVILNKIKSVYDVEFKNTDESDAFAVGLCYFIDNNIITWEKD
jgi:Holliday junction resolvasome RuvABC endonuclease subunit